MFCCINDTVTGDTAFFRQPLYRFCFYVINIDVTVMFSDNIIAHGLAHNTEPYKTNPQLYRLRLSPVIIYIKYLICLKIFFSQSNPNLILCFICPEILHLLHDCIQTGLTAIVPFSREHFSVLTVIKSLIQ